jgi:hypothetical protein
MSEIMTRDDIIQTFFYCDNKDPDGVYPPEVDIIEFAHKIAAVATDRAAKAEHARCVEIVSHMNREVAKGLETQKP